MLSQLFRSLPALLLLAFLTTPALAQTGGITGRVMNSQTGAGVAQAQVRALEAGQVRASGVTDQGGAYRLSLPAGSYTLSVTSVGYAETRVEGVRVVTGQTTIQAVDLTPAYELNPIVVSGSKRPEKVIDAPAAVAVIDNRAIAERPTATAADHLRSTPGVDVSSSGVLSANIVVRGFNNIFSGALHSLTDNRIAGVPSLRYNALHFIPANDDDIDRMEVVLGPGAALYGPNTANGVLHIMTKSPLEDQGTTVSLGGGSQSLLQTHFRSSHLISPNFGLKLSGQYLQAEEWRHTDPIEAAERAAANSSNAQTRAVFKTNLMGAYGLTSTEADRRITLIGNRDFDIQRFGGEIRADWRAAENATVVVTGGINNHKKGIELTGLGAGQAQDWQYSFAQARLSWNRLFVQGYVNASNAGSSYLIRNGAPISDQSRLYVAQAQHGLALGERQNFTYGLDFIHTNPVTLGSINGKYEDDDQTTEVGGYLQSETALSNRFKLVLAGRVDDHSALPDLIFSPRAALVFKPSEAQAFRLTYNRAFSTPSSLNQYLDIGSVIPDPNAARLGFSVRVQGTGTEGFSFRQSNGGYLMRSPFTPAQLGGPAKLIAADAATFFRAAVDVYAMQAAAASTPIPTPMLAYLQSLAPTPAQIGTNYRDVSTGAYGTLASLDIPAIAPIRESTSTTYEAGYKGVLGQRVLLAADLWHTKHENLVTPLTVATPLLLLNPQQAIGYLTQRFVADGVITDPGTAQATATTFVCGNAACDRGMAAIPLGVISSAGVNANGAQILTTYYNVDDDLKLFGADFALTALLNDFFTLSGTLSLVNKDEFETRRGQQVTLNATKRKGSLAVAYRNTASGFNTEVRARFHEGFPVRSGVYNATLCIGGREIGAEPCVEAATLFDVNMGYRLPVFQRATVQLSVQNLLDGMVTKGTFREGYRGFPGVPNIGRMMLLRMKYGL